MRKQTKQHDVPFKEYYEGYLKKHTNKTNIRLHFIGQLVTLSYISAVLYFTLTHSLFFILGLPLALFTVYPFAWSGHFFFEKNKPAAFKNPWKAKAADWVMFKDILLGRISLF
jgi:hypothetical protein